jgi:TPR repeat protein
MSPCLSAAPHAAPVRRTGQVLRAPALTAAAAALLLLSALPGEPPVRADTHAAQSLPAAARPATAPQTAAQREYEAGVAAHDRGDVVTAIERLRLAVAQSHVPAMVRLAYVLDKAEANAEAFQLYRQAAEAGNAEAALALGVMFVTGEGGTRDAAQALAWITRAAQAGHGPALVVLARAHLDGSLGLAPSRAQARDWLERGAAAGYGPARDELERLRDASPAKAAP